VHQRVAVEQVERLVALGRIDLLGGAVAVERAVDLPGNLPLDVGDLKLFPLQGAALSGRSSGQRPCAVPPRR
jgi:hypothetical protein